MDIRDIQLKQIEDFIPTILIRKFETIGLETVSDVLDYPVEKFDRVKGIGSTSVNKFFKFKRFIHENSEKILFSTGNGPCITLPSVFVPEKGMVVLFRDLVEQYLVARRNTSPVKTAWREERLGKFFRMSFGLNTRKHTYEEIGRAYELTSERVRQIIESCFIDLACLLNNQADAAGKYKLHSEAFSFIQSFKNEIEQFPIIYMKADDPLLNKFGIDVFHRNINYLILCFRCLGYEKLPVSSDIHLKGQLIFIEKPMREMYLKINRAIIEFLVKKIFPVSMNSIVTEIRKTWDVSESVILNICHNNCDIEQVENQKYQVRFQLLNNLGAFACRILYEIKTPIHRDELKKIIAERLNMPEGKTHIGTNFRGKETGKYLVPVGLTGYWTLRNSKYNTDTQFTLIRKALKIARKPVTAAEIIHIIHNSLQRKEVKAKCISTILRMHKDCFLLIKGERSRYVLVKDTDA